MAALPLKIDLQQNLNITKFGEIFNLNMLSAILGGSYPQKSRNPQNRLPYLYSNRERLAMKTDHH